MDSQVLSSQSEESWTNQKHVNFLNSMEATFVRTMLENNRRLLRLDRYLPDSSDSTLDLTTEKQKQQVTSGDILGRKTRTDGRRPKRTKRLTSQPYDSSSQDQVVPRLENRRSDKDGENINPPVNAPDASMVPRN